MPEHGPIDMPTLDFLRDLLRARFTGSGLWKANVAARYATGEGVGKNGARARIWYARAAEAGEASALYELGMMLLEGEGGPVEGPRGRALLLEAASQGDPSAQKVLAYAFTDGHWGFPVDLERAEHWRRLAVAQGMQVLKSTCEASRSPPGFP